MWIRHRALWHPTGDSRTMLIAREREQGRIADAAADAR